jgi:cyclopropane fatty-acyl-phospholipid synthase-like methyltransferase
MSNYDKQYEAEKYLFGSPYQEFEAFIQEHRAEDGTALDLGCGQGRDALMLAAHGYTVTGVDASQVGVSQMLARAKAQSLPVHGVVEDFYAYEFTQRFDAIVLDSILHFEKADREKELALLDKVSAHLNEGGYLCIFVHKSPQKEKALHTWLDGVNPDLVMAKNGYIEYV